MSVPPPSREPSPPLARSLLWLALVIVLPLIFMLLAFWFYRRSSEMPGLGLRYIWIPPLVMIWLIVSTARYVQQVYRLTYLSGGLQYTLASMFGIGYPMLVVPEDRRIDEEQPVGEENLLTAIGGPGFVAIQQGHVVLLENYQGSPRVIGPGRHFITNLETIKEKVGLEERKDRLEKISATTRDGIEVVVKDVSFRYRLCNNADIPNGAGRTPENPFPYSESAVIAMTYNRNFNPDGPVTWHAGIVNAVDTIITDYVRANSIDHLSAPSLGEDPRKAIVAQFFSASGKSRFRERGAELLWIDIGHFDTADNQIAEQRVNTWQRRWAGTAEKLRVEGESSRQAAQEMGRAQGQADLLGELVRGLEDAGLPGDTAETRRRLVLVRMTQLLNTMSAKTAQLTRESSGGK